MSETLFSLANFLPKKDSGVEIEIREELAPVVERISTILPPDVLWELFSSTPGETEGRVVFPYLRVDSAVITARDIVYLLEQHGKYSPEEFQRRYRRGSKRAFEALVWVEIGFQGLENLAKSPASKNWTLAVGPPVNAEERAKGIMTTGKEMFDACLTEFARFRREKGVKDDYFTQYGVEYLLDSFSASKALTYEETPRR